MVSTLRDSFALHAGDNAENIELVMTEVGPGADIPRGRRNDAGALDRGHAMGIFAADVYLTAAELGFVNVDWLELHNGTFLNEPRDETPHVKGPAFNGIQMARLLAGPGDRLVTTSSNKRSLVVHASIREDGRVGVLLMNTQAPEHAPSLVTVALDGIAVSGRGERYDYLPIIAATAPVNAASGPITGPEPFSDMPSPFSIELAPYGVTLLLFDVQD
jgi:hypothetical protein